MTSLKKTNSQAGFSFILSFYKFVITHAKFITLMWLLVTAGLMIPASSFEIDASADTLLTNDNQAFLNTRKVTQQFSPEEFLIIAYQPNNGTVLEPSAIKKMTGLSSELAKLERVKIVRSLLNVPLLTTIPISEIDSDLSKSSIENNQYTAKFLSDIFKGHPIFEELIISKDQKFAALQVIFHPNKALDELNKQLLSFDLEKSRGKTFSKSQDKEYKELTAAKKEIEEKLNQQRNEFAVCQHNYLIPIWPHRANYQCPHFHYCNNQDQQFWKKLSTLNKEP